jgi:hypothetical protein
MRVYVVNPVLLRPGAVAPESDVEAVRAAIPAIQAWFAINGVPLLLLDPKTPALAEPWDALADYPGGAVYAVQDLAVREGWRSPEDDGASVKALCFLEDYTADHGESLLTVAVVGYAAVAALATARNDGIPTDGDRAAGLVAHEIGHLLGLKHCETPGCLMSVSGAWMNFPAADLCEWAQFREG